MEGAASHVVSETFQVTHKEATMPIMEQYNVAITTKGIFVAAGKIPPPGERKLHLIVEGTNELGVANATKELKRILEEATLAIDSSRLFGRYTI